MSITLSVSLSGNSNKFSPAGKSDGTLEPPASPRHGPDSKRTVSQRATRKRTSRKPCAPCLFFAAAKLFRDRTPTNDRRPREAAGALALGAALTPRHRERAFPIAAGDVFFQTKMTSTFSAIMLNALPMWRKNCGPHALADLRLKLQEEKAIFIIFPEGGRSRTGSMMPFKHGLGMLVAETNVPVVPCGLIGTFDALPAERNFPRPGAIKLAIGNPLQFGSIANDRSGWSQIAKSVESNVRDLIGQSRTA